MNKKNLVSLLLALAVVSPAAVFAEDTAETAVTTSVEVLETEKEAKLQIVSVEKDTDIAEFIDEETVILDKDGEIVEAVEAGSTAVINKELNIIVVSDENVDIDAYVEMSEEEGGSDYKNAEDSLVLNIGEETVITDLEGEEVSKDALSEKILVVYYGMSTRSIPAQTTPTKIVVVGNAVVVPVMIPGPAISEDEKDTTITAPGPVISEAEEMVLTDIFVKSGDEEFGEFINVSNTLALNIGEDAIIVDEAGTAVAKDSLDGKVLEVHYTMQTMSIPAQTNPVKIVVKDSKAVTFAKGETAFTTEFSVKDGIKFVPVRKTAEGLGYIVGWLDDVRKVTITEGDKTIDFAADNNADVYIENDHTFFNFISFAGMMAEAFGDVTYTLN